MEKMRRLIWIFGLTTFMYIHVLGQDFSKSGTYQLFSLFLNITVFVVITKILPYIIDKQAKSKVSIDFEKPP